MTSDLVKHDFYVTLDSQNTRGYGTSNQPFEFINELYCDLNFPENKYEVALTDMEFTVKYSRVFCSRKSDGAVTFRIEPIEGAAMIYEKATNTVSELITALNSESQKGAEVFKNLVFAINTQSNRVLIVNREHEEFSISIPQSLSEIFGFDTNVFYGETTIATRPPSSEMLEFFPNGTSFRISFNFVAKEYTFNFLEGRDLLETPLTRITELATVMNDSFSKVKIGEKKLELEKYVLFKTSGNDFMIEPVENATNFTMKFSETFNYYLGLSKDFVFTKEKYSFRTFGLHFANDRLNVYLEGAGNWYLGSKVGPLLLSFSPAAAVEIKQQKQFTTRYYVPLVQTSFSYLKIYILDDKGESASFMDKSCKVTLHFRRKLT